MIASKQNAAPHAPSRRQLIDPGDGVFVLLIDPVDQVEIFVEMVEANGMLLHVRRRHLYQAKTDGQDQNWSSHRLSRSKPLALIA